MKTKEIIDEVKAGTIEYNINDISASDVLNTRKYIEDVKLNKENKLETYERLIHEQICQIIQWYFDTEDLGYLDSARNLLLVLIDEYITEGYLR